LDGAAARGGRRLSGRRRAWRRLGSGTAGAERARAAQAQHGAGHGAVGGAACTGKRRQSGSGGCSWRARGRSGVRGGGAEERAAQARWSRRRVRWVWTEASGKGLAAQELTAANVSAARACGRRGANA
jgi:hypothetical protein